RAKGSVLPSTEPASGEPARAPEIPGEVAAGVPHEPSERVRRYMVAKQTHEPGTEIVEPPPPPKPFSQLLPAFMEEKNIRWGELAGGLLIVCSSIALVLSFWAKIAERPFLKFFVFNGVTAALFGAGFYTERRWKLPTTSRGLDVIATLLVPLNLLAIA